MAANLTLKTDKNGRQVLQTENGAFVNFWGTEMEESAAEQVSRVADLPFIYKHIAIMPDVHAGIGATIGSVIPTVGAVVPSAVGVDIGCGMAAVKTNIQATSLSDEQPALLRKVIEKAVPHGRTNNGGEGDRGAWGDIPEDVHDIWDEQLDDGYVEIIKLYSKARGYNSINHLGTLGTGNHFIELSTDEDGFMWVLLHSGSRGPGNRFGSFFIKLAKDVCARWFITTPDPNLAYFPQGSDEFIVYMKATNWAQHFAKLNREIMMERTLTAIESVLGTLAVDDAIDCHHNYVAQENHFGRNVFVTRKGAIRARTDDIGIIPGSMGALSYIVRGLGNVASFCSAPHGAGRRMSRTAARNTITLEQHRDALEGVECDKSEQTLDEAVGAYKDIADVMKSAESLVVPVHQLKQFVCIKG